MVWTGTLSGVTYNYFLVADKGTNEILEYNAGTGAYLGIFVTAGELGLNQPQGMAIGTSYDAKTMVTTDLNVYVGSSGPTRSSPSRRPSRPSTGW